LGFHKTGRQMTNRSYCSKGFRLTREL
jgi:hypothetical protein